MEMQLRSITTEATIQAADPPPIGEGVEEVRASCQRLADASHQVIGEALGNVDVDQFLDSTRRQTGAQ
jgi:hypothetical protein